MGQALHQLRFVAPDVSLDAFLERLFAYRFTRRLVIDQLVSLENPQVTVFAPRIIPAPH